MLAAAKMRDGSNGEIRAGAEIMPLRLHSIERLVALKEQTGVEIGVAGVTTESYRDYLRDLWYFFRRAKLKTVKEIGMNIVGIGAQSEPSFTRRFGNHLDVAVALGATYLAMHYEPTQYLVNKDLLPKWTSTDVLYGRKLNWGPLDNRPEVLSWDIYRIRDFIHEWQDKGSNIGAILPTDTALRTGYDLPDVTKRYDLHRAFEVLNPQVIQVGDYHPEGKREKLAPGQGLHQGELAELIQESSRLDPDRIFTIEVYDNVEETVGFVCTNYRG